MSLRVTSGILAALALVFLSGYVAAAPERAIATESPVTTSVWTMDLVRTLPGQQAEYLRSIEANWASSRRIASQRGAVLSYRAFVAMPDSVQEWDVVLMTEYADSTAWANREAIFDSIFASPGYVRVVLRTLLSGP
jgi:hypothetical protein